MSTVAHEIDVAAARAVDQAAGAGAQSAEAFVEETTDLEIRIYDRQVESLTSAGSRGIGLRVYDADGRVGYAYGTDLSDAGLARTVQHALGGIEAVDPDPYAGLPDTCGAASVGSLVADDFADFSTDDKVHLAVELDRAARERTGVSQVEQTLYADSGGRIALANSNGFSGAYETTSCYAWCSAFAGTGEDLMTGLGVGIGRSPSQLDPQEIGHEAADRAVAMTGARKTTSRACPIVLDQFVAASFLGLIAGTLSADVVQKGRSLFADRVGEVVASSVIDLVDDGVHPGGHATAPFDGEGVAQRRTPLIVNERLSGFLFDSRSGRQAGTGSTGSGRRGSYRTAPSPGTTNLVLAAGEFAPAELFERACDGFYVTGIVGLHSGVNPVSGTFSVGATGFEIRNGELAEPVREATIAGDMVAMLSGVTAIGSDARWVPFGGMVHSASLLIDRMTVSSGG